MRYKVDYYGDDKYFDNMDDLIDWCIEDDYHSEDSYFEEWVNELYSGVVINGYDYSAYDIISAMDDCCYTDLKDTFCEEMNDQDENDARRELERADVGDELYIQQWTVHVIEDDTGDPDGDDIAAAVADLRRRMNELAEDNKRSEEENKKDEFDLLQIIGG